MLFMKAFVSLSNKDSTFSTSGISFIKKDIPTALKTKNLFEKTIKNYPFTADIESETELIQITETKAIMPLNNL